MNAPVTRRALLGATAAVGAAVLPTIAEAAIPVSDLDAEWLQLLDRWREARTAWDATDGPFDAAFDRARAACPPMPDSLHRREGDFLGTRLGTGLSDCADDERRRYGARAAEWLRRKPAAEWFGGAWTPTTIARWEERRQEIVEAHDGWMQARERVEEAVGYTAAVKTCEAAASAFNDAENALKMYEPQTLAGLIRKAAWVADLLARGVADDDLGEVFAQQVAAFGGVGS